MKARATLIRVGIKHARERIKELKESLKRQERTLKRLLVLQKSKKDIFCASCTGSGVMEMAEEGCWFEWEEWCKDCEGTGIN